MPDEGELANISRIDHVLKSDDKSLRDIGREYTQKLCFKLYGEERLKQMSKKEQWAIYNQHFPKTNITAVIKAYISNLSAQVNVKQPLSENQIDLTAKLMYDLFAWKAGDLKVFFYNILTGVYGGLYENLSPDKILAWARLYLEDRAKVAEVMQMNEDGPLNLSTKVHPEVIKVMFEGVGEERPKVLEKKEGVFLNNEKAFRAYIANQAKVLNFVELIELFYRWQLNASLVGYCDVVYEALMERETTDAQAVVVANCKLLLDIKIKVLPNQMNDGHFKQIEDYQQRIITFIEQNKKQNHVR